MSDSPILSQQPAHILHVLYANALGYKVRVFVLCHMAAYGEIIIQLL
jgi:hypothetical protein